jgi:hypothetical protein
MKRERYQRRGISAIYMIVAMVGLCALCSLGVDYGHVQLVKTELRRAADSSARAAASQMRVSKSAAIAKAVEYAGYNKADGSKVVLDQTNDIEFGMWNPATRKFTKSNSNDISSLNAVHVIARRITRRGTSVPLMFARVLGQDACDVEAETIVQFIDGVKIDDNVPATANPYLSGMPKGTIASVNNPHNSPDFAGDARDPKQSPWQVNIPLSDNDVLTFDSISGDARHDPNLADYAPDGELDDIGTNTAGPENGLSNLRAPINALVGVFLDDTQPNKTTAPDMLDYKTDSMRNLTHYEPKLKQLFFIGDGLTKNGVRQEFQVPKGATKLFLATWDFFEWNNNSGQRNVRITRPDKILTVK